MPSLYFYEKDLFKYILLILRKRRENICPKSESKRMKKKNAARRANLKLQYDYESSHSLLFPLSEKKKRNLKINISKPIVIISYQNVCINGETSLFSSSPSSIPNHRSASRWRFIFTAERLTGCRRCRDSLPPLTSSSSSSSSLH